MPAAARTAAAANDPSGREGRGHPLHPARVEGTRPGCEPVRYSFMVQAYVWGEPDAPKSLPASLAGFEDSGTFHLYKSEERLVAIEFAWKKDGSFDNKSVLALAGQQPAAAQAQAFRQFVLQVYTANGFG